MLGPKNGFVPAGFLRPECFNQAVVFSQNIWFFNADIRLWVKTKMNDRIFRQARFCGRLFFFSGRPFLAPSSLRVCYFQSEHPLLCKLSPRSQVRSVPRFPPSLWSVYGPVLLGFQQTMRCAVKGPLWKRFIAWTRTGTQMLSWLRCQSHEKRQGVHWQEPRCS